MAERRFGGRMMIVLIGLSAPALMAWDDDTEELAKFTMRHYDKNKDGKISRDEWDDKEVFKKADRNNDGKLAQDELSQYFKQRKEELASGKKHEDEDRRQKEKAELERKQSELAKALRELKKYWDEVDTNRDDKMSWDEVKRSKKDFKLQDFEEADTSEDGFVDIKEWGEFLRARAAKNEPPKDRPKPIDLKIKIGKDQDPPRTPARIEEQSREKMNFHLKEYDADRDGKLSREEWKEGDDSFDAWDKSGDGYLNRDELIAYFRDQLIKTTEQKKE